MRTWDRRLGVASQCSSDALIIVTLVIVMSRLIWIILGALKFGLSLGALKFGLSLGALKFGLSLGALKFGLSLG